MNTPTKPMDLETVRSILRDLDQDKYHQESRQRQCNDDVWPPHLEDAFVEAVNVFATVGQKKYQIEEAYAGGTNVELIGRNDIISRYIFMKTGHFRARKQVSSHIQVWAHCKKPPSSRDMAAAEFEKIKDTFQRHYSRVSSEAKLCRRRVRRVASAGNVTLVKRALARNALGIHSDPPLADGDRKRDLPWDVDSPAKRCRRVVSELPPLAFQPLSDFSDSASEQSAQDPISFLPPWPGAALDTHAMAGPQLPLPPPLMLPQHTPLSAHPGGFAPAFDAVNTSHGMYDLGIATPVDPSVAAFTAATFAAMAGFDSTSVTPAMSAAEFVTDSLAPSTLFPQQHSKNACSAADAVSAFALAVGSSECLSQPFPPELPTDIYLPQPALHSWSQPAAEAGMAAACEPHKLRVTEPPTDSNPNDAPSQSPREPSTHPDACGASNIAEWLQIIKGVSETPKHELALGPHSDCDDTGFDWHSVLSHYLQSIG